MEEKIWLYMKAEKNTQVKREIVTVGDIAKLYCSDSQLLAAIKQIPVLNYQDYRSKHCVVSMMKLIQLLKEQYPHLEVINLGESDLLLEYKTKLPNKIWQLTKVVFICLISFFGSAFTIIAFHNDIGIRDIFAEVYYLVMGEETSGFTALEISYSIGLAAGIIIFFNHIGGRRLTNDPTPIEVGMKNYEEDVDKTMVEAMNREGNSLDVE
ncbi:MAG: stage V sporulation protein AA [Lachnospiraceae bacterium]